MLLGAYLKDVDRLPPLRGSYFIFSCMLAVVGVALAQRYSISIRDWRFFWSNLAACYAVFYLCAKLKSAKTISFFASCGMASMPIYLAHSIVAAAVRAGLHKAGRWFPGSVSIVVAIICSICIPWLLFRLTKRLKIDKVVGFSSFALLK